MPFIPFPTIPELANGMAVSAATLNYGHTAGLRYLLGESHAPYALMPVHYQVDIYRDDETTAWEGWLYHTSLSVVYGLQVCQDSAGKTAYWRIQALGSDGNWRTMASGSNTSSTYVWTTGTINIANVGGNDYSAFHATGDVYRWRVQVWTSDETYHTKVGVWVLACRKAVTGWVAPHDFGAETSDAAHFNDLRTDLLALRDVLPPVNPLGINGNPASRYITTGGETTVVDGCYRYRPESLYTGARIKCPTNSKWRWQVDIYDTAGNTDRVYQSADIVGTGDEALDTKLIDVSAAVSNVTLTVGDYYRVRVSVERRIATGTLEIGTCFAMRYSSGAPAAGWPALNAWAHGDTDLGPTELDKLSTAALMLYTGSEALWGETGCVHFTAIGGATTRYTGPHRKRYLLYRPATGSAPEIAYGDDWDEAQTLSTDALDNGWQWQDLAQYPIPWGGVYLVSGVEGAMEADSVPSGWL